MVQLAITLLPVLLLLAALLLLDSFKLVHAGAVGRALLAGALMAIVVGVLHGAIKAFLSPPDALLIRYIAPVTEETVKAMYVVWLLGTRRAGFLVDAAIQAFAVGTGFAVVENLLYLQAIGDAPLILWVVRGLGTAVLHGATTTLLAMIAKSLGDREASPGVRVFVPGWLLAVGVHSLFNHLLLPPVAMTALLLIVMPLLIVFVFERSERATAEWVGAGLDLDVELLQLIQSEHFSATRFGIYLTRLRERFAGPVVADMFCLLRLELELSAQAKGLLLARQAGLDIAPDDDLPASLDEIARLNQSIGKTGLLALKPLQVTSPRDAWHRHLLRQTPLSRLLRRR